MPVIEKKPFNNVCPQCAHTKALQRPASSKRMQESGQNALQKQDFVIKKGHLPASLAAIKQRRQIFE